MKGPTSVLNGIMSPGGTTNVITKRPKPEFAASIDQTFGSFNLNRTVLDITGPVFAHEGNKQYGSLFYRVAASHTEDGDFREIADKEKNYLYPIFILSFRGQHAADLRFRGVHPKRAPDRQCGMVYEFDGCSRPAFRAPAPG